jgi:hypothetical protein
MDRQSNKSEILLALRSGLCTFTYEKLDGEMRVATGTLNGELIPEEFHPKPSTGGPNPNGTVETDLVKYFDFGAKDWRSFRAENLKTLSLVV